MTAAAVKPQEPDLRSRHVKPDELPWQHIQFDGCEIKPLYFDPKTGQATLLFKMAPGAVLPDHEHALLEQSYVLEGTLRYSVGGTTRDLEPSESMRTPKGVAHAFSNPFDRPARALITVSPDIGAQYFKDVAAVINVGGPPDKAALVAVMGRYGLVPAAPPAT